MRMIASLLTAALATLTLATGEAWAQVRSGSEQLAAAEQSFSDIPFGAREPQPGLTVIEDDGCRQWGECAYRNTDGVEHYFWDGELVVKSVEAGDRPVAALGIGGARSMEDVLARVRRFLPEATVECREDADAPGTPPNCGATLGEGWISLYFSGDRRLIEVRIDAYQFT